MISKITERPVSEDVVNALESMLQSARAGEITGIVYVALRPGRVHNVGQPGIWDDRDLALAIHDMTDLLAVRRRAKARADP